MSTLVLTGGSQGIGLATIEIFSQAGWDCINLSRSPCPLPGVTNISCDLTDENWEAQITLPIFKAGKIVVVHNAGMLHADTIQDLTPENLRRVMELNLVAPVRLNQLLLPHMKAGSSIIYIGSTLSEKAVAGCASYVTSKHAIAGLMKASCQDLAGTDIHTCCVCPGITDTAMLRARAGNDDAILAQLANMQTCGRMIEPREIAAVIWFCANNPVMNGSVVHSNLGQREN